MKFLTTLLFDLVMKARSNKNDRALEHAVGNASKLLGEEEETDPDAIRLLQSHKTEVRLPDSSTRLSMNHSQVFVCSWNRAKPNLLASGYDAHTLPLSMEIYLTSAT